MQQYIKDYLASKGITKDSSASFDYDSLHDLISGYAPPPSSHQGDFKAALKEQVADESLDKLEKALFIEGATWAKDYLSQFTAPPTPVEGSIAHQLAEKWVFETNGHKWSNNDDTAPDNFGSFMAGFAAAKSHLEKQVKELQGNNPAISVWKEIEEELIECYEDYPAMNAEQDARKKIDEWKAKSQQELQGRKGLRWVKVTERQPTKKDNYWVKIQHKDDTIEPSLKVDAVWNDTYWDCYEHEDWYEVIEWLEESDSPAPEQVDVIDAYKEYVQLLTDELSELVGMAEVHGWKSTRHEKGIELRNKIESLQNKQG